MDEADTMFDHGFGPDIRKFQAPLKNRASKANDAGFQTVLVAATMTQGCGSTLLVLTLLELYMQSERAARKATILQMATIYTVAGGTLLNLGVTFSNQGSDIVANGSYVGAGVFLALLIRSMQR
ncbi:hypothetical protein Droror1_Dr00020297, partial [Drosera rotundifolia]